MNPAAITVRLFHWDDLPALLRLCRKTEAVDRIGWPDTDELAERWRRPGVHPEENLFVAQVGEEYVGYVVVRDHGRDECLVADGQVHPQWRRQGIGSRLFLRALDRTRERGGRALDIGVRRDRPAAVAFARHHGLEHVRSMWRMRLEPITGPEIAIPAGYGWREARGEADAEAYCRCYNASFASHWGFSPSTVGEAAKRLKSRTTRTFFAVRDGQEVGVCAISTRLGYVSGTPAQVGHIGPLGVIPDYQRRGLGRMLLLLAVAHAKALGLPAVQLYVDGENPGALRLYESAGFRIEAELMWHRKWLGP